jgi:hypothetical protein
MLQYTPDFSYSTFLEELWEALKMYHARHLKTRRHEFIPLPGIKADIVDWTAGVSFFGKLNSIFMLIARQNYKC